MVKEIEKVGKILESCNISLKDSFSAVENREKKRLRNFRHLLPETVNEKVFQMKKKLPSLHKLGTDLAVKDGKLEEILSFYRICLDTADIEYVIFGHIGDNHLHVNMLPKSDKELKKAKQIYIKFAKKALELGGTVSAEHGIGKIKKDYLKLMYDYESIQQMKRVKKAFDPKLIFNKGNVFE